MNKSVSHILCCIFLCFCLFIAASCDNEALITDYVHDTVYVSTDTEIHTYMISEIIFQDNPRVGSPLKVVLANKPVNMYVNYIEINYCWTTIDSSAGDTVYSFWPLLPQRNRLTFTVDAYSYNPPTLYTTQKSIRTEYEVIEGIQIRANDEEAVIRENLYPPMLKYGNPNFSLAIKGDTITIGVVFSHHDEAGERQYWKFLDHGTQLPELIENTRHWNISDGSLAGTFFFDDTLKTGLIKIDKWNEGGIYSGIVYSQLEPYSIGSGMYPKITFWVKRN